MESIKELFKVGPGPSSSHTIGPQKASLKFKEMYPNTKKFRVTLYGSLSATGKGHFTDYIIEKTLNPTQVEIVWSKETLSFHPNGMDFESLNEFGEVMGKWRVFSIGGGSLSEGNNDITKKDIYKISTMSGIIEWCKKNKKDLWEFVEIHEGKEIYEYLNMIWETMQKCIKIGLSKDGILPGPIKLQRKAHHYIEQAKRPENTNKENQTISFKYARIFGYTLAVSEENASCGVIVTSPTCGSAGVVPGTLKYIQEKETISNERIIKSLMIAGIIGNVVKTNASISGAEVGCQGEIGVACAMASGAVAWLLGGDLDHIESAAEIALEHHLGMTCDPVLGLVQLPCIERNAMASARAVDSARYALLGYGKTIISFDLVVKTMYETGKDLQAKYRETAHGGLAKIYTENILKNANNITIK